ncbi:SDR family NAD(P)-dependent oxidoreductase [Polynucleobacter sp. HIN5]|uniref:SDR family NAD(P)-dependent oxidoreductase n=1 Tax=Polynucleobacter sp. HIN5 TaxID=3047864 RepID=UPI0025735CAA|nr:SDR family NAD(P)-dependent oxidoreductase [Polynucleobacter sp. HIN5]BEI32942.1 GDP-mannose 4,6-dehydratase [Polynucleobacter sp. HIN5]
MNRKILITGGAGFIGANCAKFFFENDWDVLIVDNLSRKGGAINLEWLKNNIKLKFFQADIRDYDLMKEIIKTETPDVIIHLAAQVAVTTSVLNPFEDFDINARGTFNILEALRLTSPNTIFINASTNKVYGKLEALNVIERNNRYEYCDSPNGIDEKFPLEFYSPYGCSKGSADQYTLDYARIFGIKSTTFRQSCIYGERQFGVEDQGWVAWFAIAAALDKEITIYGDGMQIRDVLSVKDLAKAYLAAIDNIDKAVGQAFNIGGGPENTLSLIELIDLLEKKNQKKIPLHWDDWRPGDQQVFVCDVNKAKKLLKWVPTVTVKEGVGELVDWVQRNKTLFSGL